MEGFNRRNSSPNYQRHVTVCAATGGRTQWSSCSRLFCKPGLDQRLIGNIPLICGNLDALKKRYWQA